MEFISSIPGLNSSEGHGKAWKTNMLRENKKKTKQKKIKNQQTSQRQPLISVEIDTSTHFIHSR